MSGNSNGKRTLWTGYSENRLIELENKILQVIKTTYKTWFVPIGSVVGENDKIWTVSLNQESKNTPLVLLHGFGAGICFWCLNVDYFARDRPVYAIDLLGFGRSSRPTFSYDSDKAEEQMVKSIEEWRKQLKLDKFILLGHSFGGYLATSYTINHPDKIKHLILVDPWGFSERPPNFNPPLWLKTMSVLLFPLKYLNPLATVRAAGPFGPWLVRRMRGDLAEKYGSTLEEKKIISEYIYQCNSQNPTGETAFKSMLRSFGWAKNPMVARFEKIRRDIPITVLYGENSWIDKRPGDILKEQRRDSYVNVEVIKEAGHHIHADQPLLFNYVVYETCRISDSLQDTKPFDKISLLSELTNKFETNGVLTEQICDKDEEEKEEEEAVTNKDGEMVQNKNRNLHAEFLNTDKTG